MSATAESLAKEAEQLPMTDCLRWVELLLAALDGPDPSIDRMWEQESERRLDAFLRGVTRARDVADVLAKHLR